ncbi:hypothetical protein FGADI_13424 [Fusarium gaditjirri]|uniref:Uncharacterized protein n=1 Tax=Fusarium gaditjirri TaxID=282569 RepID=A0A8H4SPS3_9HYPO|nr:hypothetical protein FGADI_13424 [Fusarium gaditjirri]
MGWTREEIAAVYEADVAFLEWSRGNPAPRGFGYISKDVTPEEEAASASYSQRDAWNCFYGSQPPRMSRGVRAVSAWDLDVWDLWRKGTYGRISRRRRREALLSDAKGDTASCAQELERIEGEEQRDREALERATELTEKADRTARPLSPLEQEEIDHRHDLMGYTWFFGNGDNYLGHKYGYRLIGNWGKAPTPPVTVPKAGGTGDAPGAHMQEAVAQSSAASTLQPALGTLRKTCGGRITKNTSTQVEASPRTASQRHNRQRKTYKKERASRRLAKLEPEYGMLEDVGRR